MATVWPWMIAFVGRDVAMGGTAMTVFSSYRGAMVLVFGTSGLIALLNLPSIARGIFAGRLPVPDAVAAAIEAENMRQPVVDPFSDG